MIGIAIHGTTDFFFYPLTFVNWNLAIGISFLDNSKQDTKLNLSKRREKRNKIHPKVTIRLRQFKQICDQK